VSHQLQGFAELLRADAVGALRRLLQGTISLGQFSAAEPHDVLAAVLDDEARNSGFFDSVGNACLYLLDEHRSQFQIKIANVSDLQLSRLNNLILIIRRLLPPLAVVDFHRRFDVWNSFFENFVIDTSFDLRREFLRILALSQEIAAAHGLEARRLMPLWLAVCGESGAMGRYDLSYVRIALLGLRKLPLHDELSSNEDFVLQGLARWAVSQRPTVAAFEREWRLIEADFPRTVTFWADRVQLAVTAAERELRERTRQAEHTFPLAAWWRSDVDLHPRDHSLPKGITIEPPAREEHEIVLRRIAENYSNLKSALDTLLARHKTYADKTGDVFYLVRTACNVGMRLINRGPESEGHVRGARAISLAALAFEYDPTNVFAWSLMRDALVAAGRLRDAELVGWEAIRRFPEDEQWRNQLATILALHIGEPTQAAELLRDGIRRFPSDPYARAQLATILADDLNDAVGARELLSSALSDFADDEVIGSLLRRLDKGQRLRSKSRGRPARRGGDKLELPTAEARRLLFQFESGRSDEDEIREFLSAQSPDAYLTYVGERTGVSQLSTKTAFALAFDEALREGNPGALRALVARARPLDTMLIEEAIAVSEGRVVQLSSALTQGRQLERWRTLESVLQQRRGSGSEGSIVLLRDFAASNLSTNTTILAAAA
jgi:tetratricopeptide (TPR) repeat protein